MGLQNAKITALVITYNEIGYIENCLKSIEFADEIIVVDSYSIDGTYEYLSAHPKVRVIQHPFKNYTTQKAFTLEQSSNDWVIFVDADEVVTSELQKEILEKLKVLISSEETLKKTLNVSVSKNFKTARELLNFEEPKFNRQEMMYHHIEKR